MTATVAYYLEGVVIHEGALAAGSVIGSHTWGAWVGGLEQTLLQPRFRLRGLLAGLPP